MTESTCLHIQDRESGPIRVVELPWISVRIGRAAHCEVRLTDHDFADEICRLQRRGQSWRLLPGSGKSPVLLEGRRVRGSCCLPFDVPFRIGECCFTLRRDRSAEPDWEMYAGPAPPRAQSSQEPPIAEEEPEQQETLKSISASADCYVANESASPTVQPVIDKPTVPRPSGYSSQDSRERWETRWKALGAQIKARAESNRTGPDLKRPAYQSGLKPIPLREPRVPLITPPLPSAIGQVVAPIPATGPAAREARDVDSDFGAVSHSPPVAVGEGCGDSHTDLETRNSRKGSETKTAPADDDSETAREHSFGDPPVTKERVGINFPSGIEHAAERHEGRSHAERRNEATAPAARDSETEGTPKVDDLPVIAAQSEESRRDEIGADIPVQIPLIQPEAIDPEHTLGVPGEADVLVRSRDPSSLARDVEWPSAKDILAGLSASSSRSRATGGSKGSRNKTGSLATPTPALAPASWAPPVWVVGPAAAFFVVSTGLLGCVLSWSWAFDSYTAAIVTDRLLTNDRVIQRSPLPESVGPPRGGWMVSTAGHLAHWAIFLARFAGEDKQSPAETTALLERALTASPINPTARLALAQLDLPQNATDVSIRSLGLSRDAVSLAWTARRLLAVGRKEDALKLYGRAISVAVPALSSRSPVPRFIEDPGIRRYLLPGEEQVRDIIVDLIAQNAWTFEEWRGALPETPTVLIATARLLREKGRSEAEMVLDRLLEKKASGEVPGSTGPVALAARAEAFALRSRWKEADQLYRQAIDSSVDLTIARSWWFNLADISNRSDDEAQRQIALRAASAVASSDDITRRAVEIQRVTFTRSTGVKAN